MESLKLPIDFVDNYILKTSPEYALVYIYAYRHKDDGDITAKGISKAIGIPIEEVEKAIDYWTGKGHNIFNNSKPQSVADKSRYSAGEISAFAAKDPDFAALYEIAENELKRPLSPSETQTIIWIYKDLALSAAAIMFLFNFAKLNNKYNMRFIEKTALEWAEQGIVDFEKSEAKVKELEKAIEYEKRIKKLFGIDRKLTAAEKAIISDWLFTIKPTKDQLLKAYDISIEQTGDFSARYINGILINWKNEKQAGKSAKKGANTPKPTKFTNFTQRTGVDYKKLELQALKKRLAENRGDNEDE